MIKSQDDLNTCNDGHRSSDVLLSAIEKMELTKKQFDTAVSHENKILKKQLKIAVNTLKYIIKENMYNLDEHRYFIEEKLKKIKELGK